MTDCLTPLQRYRTRNAPDEEDRTRQPEECCPECGSQSLEERSIETIPATRTSPAEYDMQAFCTDCGNHWLPEAIR